MLKKIVKILFIVALGPLMLAGTVPTSTQCSSGGCCCCPEPVEELSFTGGACCPCGTIETQEKPDQDAVIEVAVSHQPIRPELEAIDSDIYRLNFDYKFSDDKNSILIHAPPLIKESSPAPLLC